MSEILNSRPPAPEGPVEAAQRCADSCVAQVASIWGGHRQEWQPDVAKTSVTCNSLSMRGAVTKRSRALARFCFCSSGTWHTSLQAVVESLRCRQLFTVRAPKTCRDHGMPGSDTDAQPKDWISGLPHYQKERLHFFLAADSPGFCTADERALHSF